MVMDGFRVPQFSETPVHVNDLFHDQGNHKKTTHPRPPATLAHSNVACLVTMETGEV